MLPDLQTCRPDSKEQQRKPSILLFSADSQ